MAVSRRTVLGRLGAGVAAVGTMSGAGLLARHSSSGGASAQASGPAAVGEWQGPFSTPVVAIEAIVLRTGKVLFLYGDHRGRGSQVYLWTPPPIEGRGSGAFDLKPAPINVFCGGHCALPDGRVLFAGGHIDAAGKGLKECAIFDPSAETNPWSLTGSMDLGRWYPTCTALADGRVLAISGGIEPFPTQVNNNTPDVYQTSGTWQQLTNATRPLPYYPFMFVLPSGNVFNAGPNDGYGSAGGDWPHPDILSVISGQWQNNLAVRIPEDQLPQSQGRTNWVVEGTPAVTVLRHDAPNQPPRQRVLVTGGHENMGQHWATARAWMIEFSGTSDAPTIPWQRITPMNYPRLFHQLVALPDGTVLAAGGSSYAENRNAGQLVPEVLDPWAMSPSWRNWAAMKRPRFHHSVGFLLPDGRMVMAGTDNNSSLEIFSPPYLFTATGARRAASQRPQITAAASNAAISRDATFTVSVMVPTSLGGAVTDVALLRPAAVTHSYDQDQRHIGLQFTSGTGGTLTVYPPSAKVAPPGYYMLVALSPDAAMGGRKIPSVARWIQLG